VLEAAILLVVRMVVVQFSRITLLVCIKVLSKVSTYP
jgi:hypothetical protein